MGTTPNYGWTYPTVNADADTWGTKLNNMAIAIDASLKTVDTATAGAALKANNLSDLANAATARTNLGLGNAAVAHTTDGGSTVVNWGGALPATVGNMVSVNSTNGAIQDSSISGATLLLTTGNLAGLSSNSTARSNLGLGSIATHNVTISSSAPSGGSDGDIWLQYA